MKENPIRSATGIPVLLGLIATLVFGGYLVFTGFNTHSLTWILLGFTIEIVALVSLFGLYMVEPNQAAVLSLFGKYVGTVKDQGLRWNNPFFAAKKISIPDPSKS